MGELQHCKGHGHVSIAGSSVPPAKRPPTLVVTYVADYHCHQTPDETTEVIVVAPQRKPDDGLHLLREVWAYMVGNLRAMASMYPEGAVDIRHTVDGVMMTRWEIDPPDARSLADAISALAEVHP